MISCPHFTRIFRYENGDDDEMIDLDIESWESSVRNAALKYQSIKKVAAQIFRVIYVYESFQFEYRYLSYDPYIALSIFLIPSYRSHDHTHGAT